ncbi:Rne/Rng family ribonuclease [Rhodovibrio salinarum]|uniref:Ribonuclease E n=1 Tax=Rhodovibrio salinarum TaxID=1087 RepID=A0A934QG73_9PROT|nr:Rne/Rng family ribonuclease [Rhodovibrio salinarum]MBK1695960.1 ribonuclease E/G [Rhodovibrio salinarum]
MTRRMLLDASHPEEARVVVMSGNRLDEFDYETKDKKQLKGNIYLAKVTRVEPSLQAAFVDYGGNRHGFLPFSEIHPDYYRLPVADREALIAEEEEAQKHQSEDENAGPEDDDEDSDSPDAASEAAADATRRRRRSRKGGDEGETVGAGESEETTDPEVEQVETAQSVETLAGDDIEDAARRRAASLGRYKIQEVIKRRQVMLVQVVKEERGNKGAALTTYLSLAGRYCVLMPNTAKGGGISRKIASVADRKRLKGVLSELHIPGGMAVIVRTAGSNRSKLEIKRDYEYLLRLWDQIRSTTLESTAPSLIYEEADLIKRAIRDLYTREMDEILVEGEEGYKAAKTFMRSLMPSHAKKVKKYEDPKVPILHRFQVEGQLDDIHNPIVQLKSGGYIVLNQTEALVAIDVNSGKATKERHIEETAFKTNLEAADEIARQLKLRDLAGLIVIDFIDMDAAKNNREVEQRLKEAMRQDRARIQLGRISPFGLLELSRQRLRPSLHEMSTEVCKTCGGSGFVRSPDSTALHVLRALEEEGIKRGGGEVQLTVPTQVALYVLNDKRDRLMDVEQRYGFRVRIETDDRLVSPAHRLDRLSSTPTEDRQPGVTAEAIDVPADAELMEDASADAGAESSPDEKSDGNGRSAKRSRRGGRKRANGDRRGDDGEEVREAAQQAVDAADDSQAEGSERQPAEEQAGEGSAEDQAAKRRRRRGKRGGRRRSRRREDEQGAEQQNVQDGTSSDEQPAEIDHRAESSEAVDMLPAPQSGDEVETPHAAADEAETDNGQAAQDPASPVAAAETADADQARAVATDETVSSDTAEAAETPAQSSSKTKRSSRSRRSRKKTEAPAQAEAGADPAEGEAAPADAQASDNGAAETPTGKSSKRKSGGGRKAAKSKAKPSAEEAPVAETPADRKPASTAPAETDGTPAEAQASEGQGADRAAAEQSGGAPTEAPVESAPSAPTDAPETSAHVPASTTRDEAPDQEAPDQGATGNEAEQPAESAFGEAAQPNGVDEIGDQPRTPKRRGWWQKLVN